MVLIKGFEKTTLVDFPGKIASTVFLPGCNFRCPYCHNPELVLDFKKLKSINESVVFGYLSERKKWVDGVCITGGEPTLHKDLPKFLKKIKDAGFLVKLDTNGTNPDMLEELIAKNLVDYVAMDIKAPKDKYNDACGVAVDIGIIEKSVNILKKSSIDYEFRTTVFPGMVDEKDMLSIAKWLLGGNAYFLQAFKPSKHIDANMKEIPMTDKDELEKLVKIAEKYIDCEVR